MQKVGDICSNCVEFWKNRKKTGKVLVRGGTTMNHKTVVPLCPFCDGDAVRIHEAREQ